MAVDIGPRIGLKGEDEYKQAIKQIVAEQKALKAELKATETGFDENASAQDKARAKAENLNKQIENQEKYLKLLKDKLKETTEAENANATEVANLREKIAKAETALNNMESELKDCNAVLADGPDKWKDFADRAKEAGDKLQEVGGKIKTVGDNMTKFVTGPLAAVAGLSIKAFTDVDEAMDEMVKMTGKAGDELADLQDTAKKLATTLPVALEDSARAVAEVSTRFDASGEKAEQLSSQFLKFAEITDTDVVSAIDSAQHAMAAWSLSTDNAGDLLDVLLTVSQSTGASVESLSQGIADNKVVFDEMGMSIYTATNFLGELDKNGVDSSSTMAGLKKALQNATKQGKPLDQALKELSDTLINGESDTEAYQDAMELFGNKAGPQLAEALRSGKVSLTDFERVAADSMGAVDSTFENTLDAPDKFKMLMNELKILGADVGGTLLESLTPAIEAVAEGIKKAAEWWAGLSPEMQKAILIIGGVVAAIGPIASIIGSITTVVGAIIPVIGTVTAAIGALNISLGPIILIIAAVAAAIAGIILVIKNWGEITEWLGGVWEKVSGWIKGAAENVGNWVSDKWNKVTEWTSQAWSDVKEWTSEAWDNVKSTVKDAAEAVGNWVSEKWENLKQKTSEAWGNIKQKVAENGGGIKGVIGTVTEQMKQNWRTAFDTINNITGGKLGEVLQKVRDKLQAIKQKFTDIFDGIKSFIQNTIEKIKGFFSGLKLELPKIKLPHFKLSGSFSLNPLSVPKLSIDWYKKAYNNAMMFTQPTVLATPSGLKGFGDGAGAEIVIGQNTLLGSIEAAMRRVGGGNTYDIDIAVYGTDGQDVEDIATAVAERLSFEINRREAALV